MIKVLLLGIGEPLPSGEKKDAHVVIRLRLYSEHGSVFDVVKNRFDNVKSMTGDELIAMLASNSN